MPMLRVRVATTPVYHYLDAQPPFGRLLHFRIDKKSGAVWQFRGKHPHTDHQIWDCVADDRQREIKSLLGN